MLVSWAMISEMPIEEPRFRVSVQIAAPSVRKSPGRVAKATVLSGTKTKPSPTPCTTLSIAIARADVSGVQPTITQSEAVASVRPMKIRMRASNLPSRRPTAIIAKNVPMPRVPSRYPLASTG